MFIVSATGTSEPGRRKLIAVLYADMVGYSRLIGLDDAGTLERLRALRRNLIDPAIEEHGGRIVQTGGDSLLVVFDSIDGAVQCAVKVQQQVPIHDGDQPVDRAIRFRVGINIGDAIADGTDLHGDAVNVAARLQAECPPGGICVSRSVRDHVHGRLDIAFTELGTLHLKNIARPIEAFVLQPGTGTTPQAMKRLPDKPSIAVLPFENLSGDPDQQYFADGLTEDILTALARFTQLVVIARNSTFVYKGRAVSIADVGRDLNVRYVLEGSVRRSGERVRVTAQLIEASTSAHLWAERYDRTLTDIFALQDEITERIVTTLVSNIQRSIIEQARRKPTGSLGAYELFLHGREQRDLSRYEGMVAAEASFERAIALDPDFALAHAELAYIQYIYMTWRVDPAQRNAQLAKGFANARRALELEASLPLANRVLGNLHLRACEHDEAIRWSQRAVALNPGEAESYAWLANVLSYAGRSAEALEQLDHARRLDPLHAVGLLHRACTAAPGALPGGAGLVGNLLSAGAELRIRARAALHGRRAGAAGPSGRSAGGVAGPRSGARLCVNRRNPGGFLSRERRARTPCRRTAQGRDAGMSRCPFPAKRRFSRNCSDNLCPW
jgi:adenylate cyclase